MRLLVKNIGCLQTPTGSYSHKGEQQGENIKLQNAAIAVEDGIIKEITQDGQLPEGPFDQEIDAEGKLVREGKCGPIMMGRDHHDVSGTDSPFRETSNIKDGSNVMADMAVQCFAGNAARGMSLCALHNGGGVGIGKSINGGFGLLLDGSERTDEIIKSAMMWDVMGGVARRNWARNENALSTSVEYNKNYAGKGHITIPYIAGDELVNEMVEKFVK